MSWRRAPATRLRITAKRLSLVGLFATAVYFDFPDSRLTGTPGGGYHHYRRFREGLVGAWHS